MRPPRRGGVYPKWWTHPHLFDPKTKSVAGSLNEEALLVDDQEDDGDEDGDEGEDDDAPVNNDNGDSDEDKCDDDNVRARNGNHTESDD